MEKFWLALAFSMMMTIAALSYNAQVNVHQNQGYVIILLVSKASSALSGLCFYYFAARHLAYLAIFGVDGAIFWATLVLLIRANRAFLEAHTAYLRQAILSMNSKVKEDRRRVRITKLSRRVRKDSMRINAEFSKVEGQRIGLDLDAHEISPVQIIGVETGLQNPALVLSDEAGDARDDADLVRAGGGQRIETRPVHQMRRDALSGQELRLR